MSLVSSAMEAFAAVVDAGNFTRAAARLGVSVPAVSKQIRRLEEELGTTLFHRSTRAVNLTEAGERVHAHVMRALEEARQAEAAASESRAIPAGLLRVAAPLSFGIQYLSGALGTFMRDYPGVRVNLSLDDRRVDILEGGFDLALRIGSLADSSLVARRVGGTGTVLCASPQYLRRNGEPVHPSDLAAHQVLRYSYHGGDWLFRRGAETLSVNLDARAEVNNGMALREMAVAGAGIILAPAFMVAGELRRGTLVPVMPAYRTVDHGIFVLYPDRRYLPTKVSAFIEFLEALLDPPPWETRDGTSPA